MEPGWRPETRSGSVGTVDLHATYVATAPVLVRRMHALVRDAGAAEDIAHEAFVRLAREVHAGRAPDNPIAWLSRVGSNLAMSRGRRLQVATRSAASLVPVAAGSPEDAALDRERSMTLAAALASLSSDERRLILLAANGYRGIEIARAMGRTHGAVRSHLHRLRRRLRRYLADAEG